MSFIKYIQSRPSHVKTQYALGISFLVTGAIAVVWITTVPARFSHVSQDTVTEEVEKDEGFNQILDNAKDQFGSVVKSQESLNEKEESVPSEGGATRTMAENASYEASNLDALDVSDIQKDIRATSSVASSTSLGALAQLATTTVSATTSEMLFASSSQGIQVGTVTIAPKVILIGTTSSKVSSE